MSNTTIGFCHLSARFTLLSFALIGLVVPMSGNATAAPVRWTCNCVVPGTETKYNCTCDGYSYDLPRSGTMTFRGYCKGGVKGDPSKRTVAKFTNVLRGKNVTCTAGSNHPDYRQKQCTNWGTAQRNPVKMSLQCSGYGY